MSGGSFDYAYRAITWGDIGEVATNRHQFARMADAMAAAGYPAAAAPLAAIVARIDALDAWVQGLSSDGVDDLAKAFEWWKSCDWSEEQFRAELERYLDGRPAATPAAPGPASRPGPGSA